MKMDTPKTISRPKIPTPDSIPEIQVGDVSVVAPEPRMEALKEARSLLMSEYGPCAANHQDLLLATARRIQDGIERSRRSP